MIAEVSSVPKGRKRFGIACSYPYQFKQNLYQIILIVVLIGFLNSYPIIPEQENMNCGQYI